MSIATDNRKVGDLTVNELRRESLKSKERIPVEKVAEELGLNW